LAVGTEHVGELAVDSAAIVIETLRERLRWAILTPKRRARREPSW
jgi:hypothetical protein